MQPVVDPREVKAKGSLDVYDALRCDRARVVSAQWTQLEDFYLKEGKTNHEIVSLQVRWVKFGMIDDFNIGKRLTYCP